MAEDEDRGRQDRNSSEAEAAEDAMVAENVTRHARRNNVAVPARQIRRGRAWIPKTFRLADNAAMDARVLVAVVVDAGEVVKSRVPNWHDARQWRFLAFRVGRDPLCCGRATSWTAGGADVRDGRPREAVPRHRVSG